MHASDDRIEELIAAAVADQLTPGEGDELRALAHEHPWIDVEIERLRDVAGRVGAVEDPWRDAVVTQALRERILGDVPVRQERPAARRAWVPPLVGAACLTVGLAVGAGIPALTSLPPSGPPGTLGAYEPIAVDDEVRGVEVDAELVAHTWGTEAVLDVTGLDVGSVYRVVFLGEDGTEFPAGEMLGSEVAIHCRLNASVLREDTVRFEIRDAGSGVVASADLPEA